MIISLQGNTLWVATIKNMFVCFLVRKYEIRFYYLFKNLSTAHLLKWPKFRTLTSSKADKAVDQQELSFIVFWWFSR